MQNRPPLVDEVHCHSTKQQKSSYNESTVDDILTTLDEEQARIRAVEELNQARIAYVELEEKLEGELSQMRKTLNDKEKTMDELQRSLEGEHHAKTIAVEELRQAKRHQEHLQNVIVDQRRHFEEELQQRAALEERVESLELHIQEERRRHLSTETELRSALSTAEQALALSRDWIIQREEIVLSEKSLGRGAWGEVREGEFRGCKVAVKEIHELILSDHNRRLFEREMSIASRCRHPNLLQFIGATNDNGSPLFVTELLDTNLRRVLSERALKHEENVILALDIAKGLNYLHLSKPNPIMHRDISSANVLLWRRDESWRAKLSDYGAANVMRQYMTANPGAIIYSAPEAFTHQQTPKVKKKKKK